MGVLAGCVLAQAGESARIDRHALVTRHNVTLDKPDPLTPLSVGNGEFAFTADITGLQTFPDYHLKAMSLGTLSQWGWHSLPNTEGYTLADAMNCYTVAGREVPYAAGGAPSGGYSPAANWLRANPHRLHLGQIGLRITKSDGSRATIDDLTETVQSLDLWTGLLSSRLKVEGTPVTVLTMCHPSRDLLAVRIESPLLGQQRLAVRLAFPYGSTDWGKAADWSLADRHTTTCRMTDGQADLARSLDADRYYVRMAWSQGGRMQMQSQHEYEILQQDGAALEVVIAFSPTEITESLPSFDEVRAAAANHWQRFWQSGGAIDFSRCTDPRASELERRVVLSQYLMAIQCAGSRLPQETGLTANSWHGKSHLEMHWWHGVHFALWDRIELLERSLAWYDSILPMAEGTAKLQGYAGARWPKMVGPDGRESPSSVGVFLIWQQPHPIYYAELCYRARPNAETLDRYRRIVFETAEFMASYPVWDETNRRYVLGPAMIPAQESYGPDKARNLNPTFELAYWRWALETAQQWRLRLGLERDAKWDEVIRGLSRPTVREGVYTGIETPPYTIRRDHPTMVAALGVVPATPLRLGKRQIGPTSKPFIDPDVMKRTYDSVVADWDWASTWGWDYPMLAMTAARLGEPEEAVDALFLDSPKNRYLANGHNYQSARLPLYLPGNGGLLTAVAMMAAGWDGCPDGPAPGFPKNGKWDVRWEGLQRMP
ncbi:MAG: glycoside hydrolase family 65 [Phycisphaerae bacterium]|nr:glycoside hydrolase family 65 [Phycisphaerae bacterium]